MFRVSLFQLVSLPGESFDFRLEAVHVTDQDSIMLGFALDIDFKLTLALRDVHQPTLQQFIVLKKSGKISHRQISG